LRVHAARCNRSESRVEQAYAPTDRARHVRRLAGGYAASLLTRTCPNTLPKRLTTRLHSVQVWATSSAAGRSSRAFTTARARRRSTCSVASSARPRRTAPTPTSLPRRLPTSTSCMRSRPLPPHPPRHIRLHHSCRR
jgi:hypothetical protein